MRRSWRMDLFFYSVVLEDAECNNFFVFRRWYESFSRRSSSVLAISDFLQSSMHAALVG